MFNLILKSLSILIVFMSCAFAQCAKISVYYHERIPYVIATADGLTGLTGSPVTSAFNHVALPFVFKETPSKRQIRILKNDDCSCLVGWFKTVERQKFSKYSLPIYQDQATIILVKADNDKLYNGMEINQLLSDPTLLFDVRDGYSYGSFLDKKIIQHKPNINAGTFKNSDMLKRIHLKRADYFFISPEEANSLINLSAFSSSDFKLLTIRGIPKGEKRYIMCSLDIEDAVMDKLNQAIILKK